MPLIETLHSNLPHLDPSPDSTALESARAQIDSELSPDHESTPHPAVDTSYTPSFPTLLDASHTSISNSGVPRAPDEGISLAAYEEPSPPTDPSDITGWRASFRAAAIAQQYLTQRQLNLGLLEKYGKNAWLIGNSQMEDQLRYLERELKGAKDEGVSLEDERKKRQESVRGEMEGLNETFRTRLGAAIEAEVAGAELRGRIAATRRGANGTGHGHGNDATEA